MNGIDANYLPELEARGVTWRRDGREIQPLDEFGRRGVNAFRLRVWTGTTETAVRLAVEAQKAGMTVLPVFFLSDNWADYVKQPAPGAWNSMTFERKKIAVREYSAATARVLRSNGVRSEWFAIGNEIDFGICGEFEERWERRFSMEWMRTEIWPAAAEIILAAQGGVREADPSARFVVHLTQWWNPNFCRTMLASMREHGVRIDAIGLSYYPSAPMSEERAMPVFFANADSLAKEFDCPIIVCEYAYPATDRISGQFAEWNRSVEGYPLTPEGQAKWIEDFLAECRARPNIAGAFYWSPEWYADELWSAFALFDHSGAARPGMHSLTR